MARTFFPRSPKEVMNTCSKFFAKHKLEKEKSSLNALKHDYAALEARFALYQSKQNEAAELERQAELLREEASAIWANELKKPLQEGKNIIISSNPDNPTVSELWGFENVKNSSINKKAALKRKAAAKV